MSDKVISFAIPCYNSAEYMDKCINSILTCGDDIEIIIVDDGSTKDDTAAKADAWAEKYPEIIKVVHKENGGHGSAVNEGLANATGTYFKVVDSDDWIDVTAGIKVMEEVRKQAESAAPVDMIVANYVYEKVFEGSSSIINYKHVFDEGEVMSWDEIGHFNPSQYLLMHALIFRTQLLKDIGLELPKHTFYVDNIFCYVPLPHVETMVYVDANLYRYFIGREDQSVNEEVMLGRMDQQLRVTRIMIDSVDYERDIKSRKLQSYMRSYLSMMMTINSVFLRMKNTLESVEELEDIWHYLKNKDPKLYRRIRTNILNMSTNVPTSAGRKLALGGYNVAQKLFNFN